MLHGSGLQFEVTNNYQCFLEIGKLSAADFVVLDQRITINALRMMLDILLLSYLFCKKD
jgi:hypothetical protein